MSNLVIKVENISKSYKLGDTVSYKVIRDEIRNLFKNLFGQEQKKNEFYSLKDINFEVNEGEVIGIIGRNGAGKTTLLKLLTQVTYPTKGEIKIKGRVGALLEVGTGFNQELSGRENIYLNGTILGMTKKEIDERFNEIVDFAGVEKFLDTPIKRYSSGMAVRLAFAIAAHIDPEILMIDEVLSVGDEYFQKKSLGKIDEISKKGGRTVIVVSHDLNLIEKVCKRVIVLDNGELKFDGNTKDGINKYLEILRTSTTDVESSRKYGDGNIKITNVQLYDKQDNNTHSINFGSSARFEFEYESKLESAYHVSISLTFESEFKKIFASMGSNFIDKFFNLKNKKGKFILEIPNLNFYPGLYFVTLTIRRKGAIEEKLEHITQFSVENSNYLGDSALPPRTHQDIFLKYDWNVVESIN